MVLSQYGRELISQKPKQKPPTKNFFTTKKQTMVSKEEVAEMIDFAINQSTNTIEMLVKLAWYLDSHSWHCLPMVCLEL